MNKLITSAVIFLTVSIAFPLNVQSQSAFQIHGQLDGLDKISRLVLSYNIEGESHRDTAEVQNGAFYFEGDIATPVKGWIYPLQASGGNNFNMPVYLEPSNIAIDGEVDFIYDLAANGRVRPVLDTDKITVSGSMAHQQFEILQDLSLEHQTKRALVNYQWSKARENDNDKWLAEVQNESEKTSHVRADAYAKFINEYPGSYVTLELFDFLQSFLEDEEFRELYTTLSPELRETVRGKELGVFVEARGKTGIGQQAPNFSQENPEGNQIQLSDFRGQYVLIDFWASWCGPCRAENPNLVKNYNDYQEDGFVILGVSLDRDKEAWVKAIEEDGLLWPQVSDLNFWNNAVALQYGVPHVPYSVLVDPEGKIIAKELRGEVLDRKLAELFE